MGIVILLSSGCNVLKFVPKGSSLVDVNFVKIEGNEKIEELKEQILLVPNRKMMGIVKFNLWSYYVGIKLFPNDTVSSKIGRKAKKTLTEIMGEKPIYLDTLLVIKSEKNLRQYLIQKGYYQAKVSSKVKTYLKRSYITYTINPGLPYLIKEVVFNGSDRLMDEVANKVAKNSILKIGDKIDTDKLSEERDRLTADFKNNGFYYFNKAFVDIVVDTGGYKKGAKIYYNISNPGALRNARQQTIQKVLVEMIYNQQFGRRDVIVYSDIHYLFNGYNIKPNIINRSIRLKPNDLFSQKQLEATYKKLIGLGLFKSVNIAITPDKSDTINKVLVHIQLIPLAKHDYNWEPQVITTDKQTDLNSQDNNPRNYGISNSIMLNNKNVFRNAEDFNIKWKLAAEWQFGNNKGVPVDILGRTFNLGNYESNLTFELLYPKLVWLRKLDLNSNLQQNRTSLNFNIISEKNSNYSRRSYPINYTWQTVLEAKKKHQINLYYSPIQLSFNNSEISQSFLSRLSPSDSLIIARTFRSYIIPSQKASIYFSNKAISPNRYWNIRSNIFELSGNLVELVYRKTMDNDNKEKKFLGIPYFQYFRTDIDMVRYQIFGKNKTLVFRSNIGYGVPYGNSVIMPFERQFFVGGSNSLRAWSPRVLGPGSYKNTGAIQIDKTGDMMIVVNAEYRFAIAPGSLDGAFFFDAGNIWEVTKSANAESKFKFDSFYKQAALNTGIGFRFNLDFFILRLDFGVPLHDPSKPQEVRWVIKDFNSLKWLVKNTQPLIAVGFPF